MADSWDDDDFVVPSLGEKVASIQIDSGDKKWVEEEDELALEQKVVSAGPSAAQLEAQRKKDEQAELALQMHLKFSALENETAQEKKLRERKQQEDADTAISGDLFGVGMQSTVPSTPGTSSTKAGGSTTGSGLGALSLKTKQEHVNFAVLCSKKMADSTPLNVAFFYKSLTDKVKDIIPADTLDEVIAQLTRVREEKKKVEAANKKAVKKTKKEVVAENQRHNDVFGGSDGASSKYDHLTGMEDDFM